MSERLVLVDTSAWIAFLSAPKTDVLQTLDKLIQDNRAAFNPVVRLELLTGAKNEKQYKELESLLDGLHFLDLNEAVWRHAERLRFDLRRKGCTIPLPDVLIASCALIYHCQILHRDKHYDLIARHFPLKLHR